jgi:hypothetical protein
MSTTYAEGRYQAQITDQGFERASTDTPFFYLQMLILGRIDADGVVQECPKYERTCRQYLKKGTPGVAILKADLKSLGVEVTDLVQLDLEAPDPIKLVGRVIDVVCEHEPHNGKTRERWSISRARKKLDLSEIRRLNDQSGH